jgi:hypothetical protein
VCETSDAELRQARELLGPVAELASFKVLLEGKPAVRCLGRCGGL